MAKAGQTAGHLRYIARASAAREVVQARLERSTYESQAVHAEMLAKKRKGRVCERFIIALPLEATEAQRLALAQRFSEELTHGKAGYILAVHDKAGNDTKNPHFHLVAFDKYERNGGRGRPRSVIGMARKNAIETSAKQWADIHNQMMGDWGYGPECFISHLSFAAQGIDRIPRIHEGPASRKMNERGVSPANNSEWECIDAGRTRAEANKLIREINKLNREIESAGNHRLGNRDAGGQEESDRGCPPFRKNRKRGVPGAVWLEKPNEHPCGNAQTTERDRRPPGVPGSHAGRANDLRAGKAQPKSSKPISASRVWYSRLYPGRGRIRRVFVELVLLRDTLRSRLAACRGSHSATFDGFQKPVMVTSKKPSRNPSGRRR